MGVCKVREVWSTDKNEGRVGIWGVVKGVLPRAKTEQVCGVERKARDVMATGK